MERYDLINTWIFKILRYVKKKRGYQHQMVVHGHLSSHLFTPKNPVWDITFEHAIRMVLLYAQTCKDTEQVHEFKDDWNKLGDAIMTLVDSGTIDAMNRMFNPHANTKH